MAAPDDDSTSAELAYLKQRSDELRREASESIRAMFRENVSADDMTLEHLRTMTCRLAEWVRRSGNPELADRYQIAYDVQLAALLVYATRAAIDSPAQEAWDAFEEASEAFERVAADVSAWCKRIDDTGDA